MTSGQIWRQVESISSAIRDEYTQSYEPMYLTADELIYQVCQRLNVKTFEELNVGPPHCIQSIREVLDTEHDLWEFIGMYVALRAISTVHEAEIEFLHKNGVKSFQILGIGNCFSIAPAVLYHFQLPPAISVLPLTVKDVLSHMSEYRFINQRFQDISSFLAHVSNKLSVPQGTVLGIHIQSIQRSMDLMRRVQLEERKQLRDIENDFRREIANSVFQMTKEKFSAENREKAIADAFRSSKVEMPHGEQKANVEVKLATDVLQQVTKLDSHLDNLIRRYSDRLPKDSSSTISKQDLKLRSQVSHKKHERSKSTVVTWVLCSIIAKSRVLLDSKLLSAADKRRMDNEEECECCCVGKDSCTCKCDCECHKDDSDDESGADESTALETPSSTKKSENQLESTKSIREMYSIRQASNPTDSMLQHLNAIERDLTSSSEETFISKVLKLENEESFLATQAVAASRLLPDETHALVYQCRTIHDEFDPEASESFQSTVQEILETENPYGSAMPSPLPHTAPFFSLHSTSPFVYAHQMPPATLPKLLEWIERLPCLIDLESALQWRVKERGPFAQFFISHFPHIPLLRLSSGRYMKLLQGATIDCLKNSNAKSSLDIASRLVSIFVLSSGRCSWSDMKESLVSILKDCDDPSQSVLDIIKAIPIELHVRIAPTLIKSLSKVVPHVHQAISKVALQPNDKAILNLLGHTLNIPSWQTLIVPTDVIVTMADPPKHSPRPIPHEAGPVAPLTSTIRKSDTRHISTAIDPSTCQALIDDIRLNSFGIGLPVSSETQSFLRLQQNRLERALQRLSAELYSTSSHFVLELLQNADDNIYGPSMNPSAEFIIDQDSISFYCNEVGFQPEHIRALCDVGASTKSAGKIGKKGIGFKSVFSISECPEIHSNGFHLHFDARSHPENVRYILPYWISNPKPEFLDGSGTWLHLPSNKNITIAQNMLEDLEPSTLLFLNQLVSLKIQNSINNTQVEYTKKWITSDVVELHTNTQDAQKWFVKHLIVQIPPEFEKGASTKIEIAIPLSLDVIPPQPVFAYLPLQSYGFKCIIQADFELPSSRESVLDNNWNHFLIQHIPELFTNMLCEILPLYPHLIQLIPTDITPPFLKMAQTICKLVQDLPIIQICSGVYVPPRQVIDQNEEDPIDDSLLWESCRKHFIHRDFASHLSPQLKRILGIQPWNANHMIDIAKTITSTKKMMPLTWYAQFMDLISLLNPSAALLRPFPLFPVQCPGDMKFSLKSLEKNLFFPLETFTCTVPFANELHILHPDWIHSLMPRTIRYLSILGIKQLSKLDVLEHHLLPLMKGKSNAEDHVKAFDFIQHLNMERPLPKSTIRSIRQTIRVETVANKLVPLHSSDLYLIPQQLSFAPPNEIQTIPWSMNTSSFLQTCGVQVFLSLDQQNGCPGLSALLEFISKANDIHLAKALVQYFDLQWTPKHSMYSSVVELLRHHAWLPSSCAVSDKVHVPHTMVLNLPSGLEEFYPSPSLMNREFATALAIPLALESRHYIDILSRTENFDIGLLCLQQLLELTTNDESIAKELSQVFSGRTLLLVGERKISTRDAIWKASKACPQLTSLREYYPKTLKPFFEMIGVPVKANVSIVLKAIHSSTDISPLVEFLSSHSPDKLPSEVKALPLFTSHCGRKISLSENPIVVSKFPVWWSLVQEKKICVLTTDPANAPLKGLLHFGRTLDQDMNENPSHWNNTYEELARATPHDYDRIKDLLCALLDVWQPKQVELALLPTQGKTYEPFDNVQATGSRKIRRPNGLDLPLEYHDVLVQWGLRELATTKSLQYDSAEEDFELLDQLKNTFNLVPEYFYSKKSLPTMESVANFVASIQCWRVQNLRYVFTQEDSQVVENVSIVFQDMQIYATEPMNYMQVIQKVAHSLWPRIVHKELLEAIQHQMYQPPTQIKRQLQGSEAYPLKRQRLLDVIPLDNDLFRPNFLSDDTKMAIGRVGEEYVYHLLRSEHANVVWVNEHEETGSPYDICIHHSSGGTEFIEVKSTSTYNKAIFEMSVQELEFASQKGSQYSIYRAFAIRPHGPLPNSRVVRLRNPITLLRQKKLSLSVQMADDM